MLHLLLIAHAIWVRWQLYYIHLCRAHFVPIWLTRLGWVQHITTALCSRGNHTITAQCFVHIGRMTCFWWQLTHNMTIDTIRLSLQESCLKINVKNVPYLAGCHLATNPKSRSCGSKRICLLIFLLFVFEISQHPSCLCLEEVTLFVRLDCKYPSSGT